MTDPPFWRDRSVLVTGCAGFLGEWLTAWLADVGANVVGIVRDLVPESRFWREGIAERITVVRGEVQDRGLLERVLGEYEVQTVVHLAAQTIVGIANRNPISTFETNIRGTWQLLEACRRSPLVRQVVIASSDKAYGAQLGLPYTEAGPLAGEHPYDVSKSCADLLARTYARTFGLPVAITRSGNFYGGGDLNFNRIVPGAIRSVIRGEPPVIRSDGSLTRDYIYVEDVVHAYVRLAEALGPRPDLAGEAFNFSNEQPVSVMELTRRILEIMGRPDLEPVVLDEATNEIPHQYLAAGKARAVLGWEPRYTLEAGLGRTIEWYRRYFGGVGRSGRRLRSRDASRRDAGSTGDSEGSLRALVISGTSLTGNCLVRALEVRGGDVVATYHTRPRPGLMPLDIRDQAAVMRQLTAVRPQVIFLTSAFASADACEVQPDRAEAVNVAGVRHVAEAAAALGAALVYYSTDYVFDGSAGPHAEDDPVAPINVYGRTKAQAERIILTTVPRALVIRTTWVFGWDRASRNFAMQVWERLAAAEPMLVPEDQFANPTLVDYLAEVSLRLVQDQVRGIVNVAGRDRLSRADFARALARTFEMDPSLVRPTPTRHLGQRAPRPLQGGLKTDRLQALLHREPMGLDEALARLRGCWRAETCGATGAEMQVT